MVASQRPMPKLSDSISRRLFLTMGWLVVTILALAPWWHNRLFLRDLFDYGLMIIAAGRLNTGETPWVDFLSVHQSGSLWINALAERWLGGDYQALVWGNAWFIVASIAALALLLNLRNTPWSAYIISLGVVAGSASQHTIIWYNSIGVITLAGIGWISAQTPVWSRESRWKILTVAALLVLSGTNKLNFHALALAVACAWPLRAGLIGNKPWSQVGITLLIWLSAGLLLPLLLELQLSGATFEQWKFNIIDLPFASRGDNLSQLLKLSFYLHPMHDYYGRGLNPVGAILVAWIVLTIGLAWPKRSIMDRTILVGAGLVAVGGTGGLMATNHEIIYMSLAAGVGLVVSLWLGFGIWHNLRYRIWGLVVPTAMLTVIMLHSAWLGQRSQFGHSDAPRSAFQMLDNENESFAYFAETYLPPRIQNSIEKLETILPAPNENGILPVFYATGGEFLERIWPNLHLPNMPIVFAALTSGPDQENRLHAAFVTPPTYQLLIGPGSWKGSWSTGLADAVALNASKSWEEDFFEVHRFDGDWLHAGIPPVDDSIAAKHRFGGNMDVGEITVDEPLWPFILPDGRTFLGTYESQGTFSFHKRSFRLNGEVILTRYDPEGKQELAATFEVLDASIPEGKIGSVIWQKTITLPGSEISSTHPYKIDTRGQPSRFRVRIDEASTGLLKAGFTGPHIHHSDSTPAAAPILRRSLRESYPDREHLSSVLLPSNWTDSVQLDLRGGRVSDSGDVELSVGDELWLKPNRPINELTGTASLTATNPASGSPLVRVVWYRGGRLEILHQKRFDSSDGKIHFNAWPAEDDGWFGILIDGSSSPHPVQIKIDHIQGR